MPHFRILLDARAGEPCPITGTVAPSCSEEFTVEAADRRAAYRMAPAKTTLVLRGQTLYTYIDGVLELGNH